MGPFSVDDVRLERSLERIEGHLDRADAREIARGLRGGTGSAPARLAQSLTQSVTSGSTRRRTGPRRRGGTPSIHRSYGVKVRVSAPGLVAVPVTTLKARGAPRDISRVQVTAQGQPVPFRVGRDAHGVETLQFLGETLSTDYSGENVYLITWTARRPKPVVALSRSGDLPWEGYTRVERSFAYVPSLPLEVDPWQWDALITGWGTWPYEWWDATAGTFDLPVKRPPDGTSVTFALRLVGATPHTHTVDARLNGWSLGSLTFEGETSALLTGEVPAEVLRPTGNQLELDYSADVVDPWADYGIVYVDHIDFRAPVDLGRARARWELAPWDPAIPMKRTEYLIVTHADFTSAALRIAQAKSEEGLRTSVVDVERAYDAYSGGVPEAAAVKALIRDFARWGVRYVLLVGDDTFDTHDYMGTGAVSYVPSAIGWDGVWGRIPSENLYADLDDDGRPDLAIGRLPVQTLEQANTMADKIVNQATLVKQSAGRHLMAVDDSAPGDPQFLQEALTVPLPPRTRVAWADVGQGIATARQSLFSALEEGAQVTHYFGHGGPEVWADEGLLTTWDVPALEGTKPTVLFTWACQSQWYLNLWGPSLNEALLLLPEGGAVASFGPAGITTPRQQRKLAQRVYGHFLRERLTLGEAIEWAKSQSLAEDPESQPAIDGWNLLGDPALRLPSHPAGPRRRP
jgi:hypothetical protein